MPQTPSPLERQTTSAPFGFSIALSIILAFTAALLTLSIIAASLDRVPALAAPGAFFFNAYGYLSFLVPAYLLVAAFILADRSYRPDRIFALSCTVVPFLTLAAGFSLLRDPLETFGRYPILETMGVRGIGALIAAVTALECLGIVSLTAALFPKRAVPKTTLASDPKEGDPLRLRFLPPPKEADRGEKEGEGRRQSSLERVYLDAAEAVQARNRDEVASPASRLDVDDLLPELKPLSSLAAERELSGEKTAEDAEEEL